MDILRNLDGVGGEIVHTGNHLLSTAKKSQISLTSTAEIIHTEYYRNSMDRRRI